MKELITYDNPKSIISESIKGVRTNLLFSSIDKKLKTILVTSSIQGEGKSFISSNLAIAFSQSDYKVLLVDCDMRKGRLDKIFGLTNDKGLSDMLIEGEKIEIKPFVKKTAIPNVSLITLGTVPPNPLELLSSSKFQEFIEKAKSSYDLVILDSPPINVVSDSVVLTKLVDETVIVTTHRKTEIKELINAKKAILNAGGNIAGVVLNNKKTSKKSYYGKYYQ
ncbi:MAG: CpsD/CapB family tyrosine-protein kinase [Bacilli bacterium]|nr:CpsD/CapB family tyrosine-protein kinase [Bacilli bacterium]MDD4733532.1 CpsD/CapB family tyrosine-protein kinase [Bacilli bacterium]